MTLAGTGISRRDVVLGGALLGASALAFARQPHALPQPDVEALDAMIPTGFGGFRAGLPQGFVLPEAGAVTRQTYVDVLTRLYLADGFPAVMLLIARGRAEDPGMTVHRPERCYRASGFSVGPSQPVPLPPPFPSGANAVRMTARRDKRTEQIWFWTRVGSQFPDSGGAQKLASIRANLAGVLPAGLLLRLSVVDADEAKGFALLNRFHTTLLGAMTPARRAAVLGL